MLVRHTSAMVRVELFLGLISLGLAIYALIDVIRTPDASVPHLPKWGWIVLVVIMPFVASVAWLFLRPRSSRPQRASAFPEYERPGRAKGLTPESDEEFLRRVRERAEEQRRRHREGEE